MSISSKIKNERNNMMVVLNNNLKTIYTYGDNDDFVGYDVHFGICISLKDKSIAYSAVELLKETCSIICKENYEIKTLENKDEVLKYVPCLEYGYDKSVDNLFYVETKINGYNATVAFYEKNDAVYGYIALFTEHVVNTTVYEDEINEGTIVYAKDRKHGLRKYKVIYRDGNTVRYCQLSEDGSLESIISYKARVTKDVYWYGFNTKAGFATANCCMGRLKKVI